MKKTISLETIAAMAHNANHEYCKANGEPNLHKYWDEESEAEKRVSLNALRSLLKNGPDEMMSEPVERLAEDAWREWKVTKTAEGWKYGKEKNSAEKTHPCLTNSYSELPVYEKVKDQIYICILKMALANYEIEP